MSSEGCFTSIPSKYAVQLKVTDAMWKALQIANKSGLKMTLKFGTQNILTVGEQIFTFKAHQASLQDVIRIPCASELSCSKVAQINQRLHIQRVMTEAERERVRNRGKEAETQRRGRTAQVLDVPPKANPGRQIINKSVFRSVTPPAPRNTPTKLSKQIVRPIHQPNLINGVNPVLLTTNTPQGVNLSVSYIVLTPEMHQICLPLVKHKPAASISKLGKPRKYSPSQSSSTGQLTAPALAVAAAAKGAGLRKVLVACIANDRPKKPRLDKILADVAVQVPTFRINKQEVSRILKEVAEFKAPGVYVLTEFVGKRELSSLQEEFAYLGCAKSNESVTLESNKQDMHKKDSTIQEILDNQDVLQRKNSSKKIIQNPHSNLDLSEKKVDVIRTSNVEKLGKIKNPISSSSNCCPAPLSGKIVQSNIRNEPGLKKNNIINVSPNFEDSEEWFTSYVREPCNETTHINCQEEFDAVLSTHNSMYTTYVRIGREINSFKRNYHALLNTVGTNTGPKDQSTHLNQAENFYQINLPKAKRMDKAFKTLHKELLLLRKSLGYYYARSKSTSVAGISHCINKDINKK